MTFSRAGSGDSSRDEGRSVASAAADAAALADHLGVERFLAMGWSGGGPHALACAALLRGRVRAAATIAGVAPYDAQGLDWTAGMGESNQIEYPLAARDPDELLRWMEPSVEALSVVTPTEIVTELRTLISDVDEAVVDGELGDLMATSFHRAFRAGPWGWFDDDLAFVRPWGFELSSIGVPVSVWQGAAGSDGAVRGRPVASRAHPDGSIPPAPGTRTPLARGRLDGRDPRRPARGRGVEGP
jgi:pimeloyl-ACP methyl ester carboxylesterase